MSSLYPNNARTGILSKGNATASEPNGWWLIMHGNNGLVISSVAISYWASTRLYQEGDLCYSMIPTAVAEGDTKVRVNGEK